jgi:2-polyprenyl-3-methyl-5-hydroxy-6-metoxy-1,4-benzoquinol methylase
MTDDTKTVTIDKRIDAGETLAGARGPMGPPPDPMRLFEAVLSFHRTAALKTGVELDLFTLISAGADTADAIAERANASERGIRILCDFLVVMGFLTKTGNRYELTPDSAIFLDRKSPAYAGEFASRVLLSPAHVEAFNDFTAVVRKGGTVAPDEGIVAPEHPMWVEFAQVTGPRMALPAEGIAKLVAADAGDQLKVLDIAAGHGQFGLAIARHNPNAHVVAVDWPNVLAVAEENWRAAGIADRFTPLPGSAFDVDYGTGYHLVLVTNFFHHFDPMAIQQQLDKVNHALNPGGRIVILEPIRDEEGTSPSFAIEFAVQMLATTPGGDTYTFAQYRTMLERAGFVDSQRQQLRPSPFEAVTARKKA